MGAIRTFLWGKKTYLMAAGMVLVAGAYAIGWIDDATFKVIDAVLFGGAIAAMRAGVAKR